MKGYKAFEKGLICDPTGQNPFQYAENTVFETDTAEPCNSGFHFCKNPLDTPDYYPLIDDNGNMTEFAEVEAFDDVKTDVKECADKDFNSSDISLAVQRSLLKALNVEV